MASAVMNGGGGRGGALRSFLTKVAQFVVVLATTLLGLVAVTFFIGRVVPIDPVIAIVGDRAPAHVYERVRTGTRPRPAADPAVLDLLKKAATGDFGNSVLTTNPVMTDIANVFPATLELATLGTLIGMLVGVPLGVLAAVKRGSLIDQFVRVLGLVGYSVPIFWLGLMALLLFYAKLGWVEGPGRLDVDLFLHLHAASPASCSSTPLMQGQIGRVLERGLARHPAGLPARLFLARLYQPHDALLHAQRAGAGIRRSRRG